MPRYHAMQFVRRRWISKALLDSNPPTTLYKSYEHVRQLEILNKYIMRFEMIITEGKSVWLVRVHRTWRSQCNPTTWSQKATFIVDITVLYNHNASSSYQRHPFN